MEDDDVDDDMFDDDVFDDDVSDGKDVFDAFVVDCERGRGNHGSAEALTGWTTFVYLAARTGSEDGKRGGSTEAGNAHDVLWNALVFFYRLAVSEVGQRLVSSTVRRNLERILPLSASLYFRLPGGN
jgi:hypothetical protein